MKGFYARIVFFVQSNKEKGFNMTNRSLREDPTWCFVSPMSCENEKMESSHRGVQ